MTNYEHFKKDIEPYSICATPWAFCDGKVRPCEGLPCDKCEFNNDQSAGTRCYEKQFAWLTEEYKEPGVDWSNIPIDTKILVSNDGKDWLPRHFAGIDPANEKIKAWLCGCTSWTVDHWCPINDTKSWNYAKLAEDENE